MKSNTLLINLDNGPNLDENDSLLILEIEQRTDKQGWMPKKFWTWLNGD